jgi:hypothetical protein
MNLYQAQSFLTKAERSRVMTDGSVESVRETKTLYPNTDKAWRQAAFLGAFAHLGSIAMSAKLAGINRATHYDWLAKDAQYRAAFKMAVAIDAGAKTDALIDLARGVFEQAIYKGKLCFVPRKRTICQLADGTSAFEDELPKGAKVIGSSVVKVKVCDGEMVGKTKRSSRALLKLASVWLPEFRNAHRRLPKPGAR